ncbi:cyclic dehypoxanthinyl futalosine synthase [Geoalkalibacter halelectricus]|uniref:Cyclic dehypoxanthine futalosine synthase n=1 Tax=Geoalkalibacter halelectricus TaxID=2847045 RepID=A0ABY5ZJQ5_9BACT|nr:cyclic dehypoxanthinyl futalosine synthase [Geoalkalibacter halelectricus]MDO3378128.1 dehypoxanthine futalosine cyclase [Geoalkalibacter halelectricus]UWZ77974.1 dehypoxanthine futalosine cyclase [Geoalkalibacter halelectricus]
MLENIREKIAEGQTLTRDEALWLLSEADLLALGKFADRIRRRKHPHGRVTFVIDRNVNYTNVCESKCKFCAFYRSVDASDAYLLDPEAIFAKIAELVAHGGTQLLMQGGLHPELRIDWFEDLFRAVKARFPQVQVHSLSPAEVIHVARLSGLSMPECLRRLQAAGLDSVPGGGAEVLVDEVRREISPNKIGWRDWAAVMEEAHRLGMRTTATLMFGSKEAPADIVEHLLRVRDIQARTGGFTAFIPWTYQPSNTELGGDTASGVEYLRVLALSRILLDNIANIQASWVTQGAMLAQVALFFGANDLGGTMLEENVVAAAGCSFRLSIEEIIELARGAGFTPAKRNTLYEILQTY